MYNSTTYVQVAPLDAILADPTVATESANLPRQARNSPKDPVVYLDRMAAVFR